jgi:hypothetical protein
MTAQKPMVSASARYTILGVQTTAGQPFDLSMRMFAGKGPANILAKCRKQLKQGFNLYFWLLHFLNAHRLRRSGHPRRDIEWRHACLQTRDAISATT